MKILHYALGINRKGGLNKYVVDLASGQLEAGHDVNLLFPSGFSLFTRETGICDRGNSASGVHCFELQNPLPVPLLYGIRNPDCILKSGRHLSASQMESFYQKTKPDILHLHTLMGFPSELLPFLKKKGSKVVFTTHDYFGLCPKVNLVDCAGHPCAAPETMFCGKCNSKAPSALFLLLRNSSLALKLKDVLLLLKRVLPAKQGDRPQIRALDASDKSSDDEAFLKLRAYYIELFKQVDLLHFNSSVSRETFSRFFSHPNTKVLGISHANILDRRQAKGFNGNFTRIAFVGSLEQYKGFPMLKSVLQRLEGKGIKNWSLKVWGSQRNGTDSELERISYCGSYSQAELDGILEETDVMIMPSICKETFGFVALEALSRGVPVLVSDNVGMKDIISNYAPSFVFSGEAGLESKLKEILKDCSQLASFNQALQSKPWKYGFAEHLKQMEEVYKSLLP